MVLRPAAAVSLAALSTACDSYRVSGEQAAGPVDGGHGDGADADSPACADCEPGCADGEREGFLDLAGDPDIAGCSGGFAVPGLLEDSAPTCQRGGGDDGANPTGDGCNAADLCAAGWHVCSTAVDVATSSATGDCSRVLPEGAAAMFFATRQSGPGYQRCGDGANDLFGCGNVGRATTASCRPLDRESWDLCSDIGPPWICGGDVELEAENASKPDPSGGGVLCCRDLQ